jgi:hypothetical protein
MGTVQIHHHIVVNRNALQEAIERSYDSLYSDIEAVNKTNAELLANHLEESIDFPDTELADSIEKASKDFRQNFKLRL